MALRDQPRRNLSGHGRVATAVTDEDRRHHLFGVTIDVTSVPSISPAGAS
jgi:hypothetical protein